MQIISYIHLELAKKKKNYYYYQLPNMSDPKK